MHSSIQRIINLSKTCKKAVRAYLKRIRRIKVFGSKICKRARDSINTTAEASQGMVLKSVDNSPTVVYNENLQSKKRTERVQHENVKSKLNTEDVLLAGECDPANAKNAADISLSSRLNNEEEPCKSKTMVVRQPFGEAENRWIVDLLRKQRRLELENILKPDCSKRTEISVSSRCETIHENKTADASNKCREDTAMTKSPEFKYTMMVEEECIKINKSIKMQAVAIRTSRAILKEDCKTRRKSLVSRAARKAKLVRFLINGDRFCKGVVLAVTHKRYRSFDRLLAELSHTLSENKHLPRGVRTLFSTDGCKILQLEDLEDGKFYFCSSGNNFIKKLNYAALNDVKPFRILTKLQFTNNVLSSPREQLCLNIRPKIIFVVRSGPRPRKIIRMLLNKRNSPSFEHVLTLITESIKLDTGAVRKIYMSSGCEIMQLEEFFEVDDLFFAYESERIFHDDLKLNFEEMKIVQSYKSGLKKPVNELKNGTHCMDESGRRLCVSRLPKTTKANQNITSYISSKILKRYTIGDRLGNDFSAVVYRCFDKRNNTECAMKVIKNSKEPNLQQMIKDELSILKILNHPNIIHLLFKLVTPTDVYIYTELVSGGNLSEYMNFSEREIRLMIKKLASALAYIHGMDIVHRDVKMENILIEFDSDGHVLHLKLADFGMSQKVNEPLYLMCGTPTYMAPEMIKKDGYGVKIDVWAVGVLLYTLICGSPPYYDDNQAEMLQNIVHGVYYFPESYCDNLSEEAKYLIDEMLQYVPSDRLSAEDILGHP